MTVNSSVTVHEYTGNGVQTEWPVLFPFFSPEDVRAIRTGVDGTDAVLVYGSDYTVVPAAEVQGGTAICTVGSGERLTLFLDLPLVQQIDLTNTGMLAPEVLERGLDRLTLISQQLKEEVGRCVQIGRTSGLTPNELLASIDTSVAACTAAQAASGQSAAEAYAARGDAVAAAGVAAAAAASLDLPAPDSAESGRGLVVAPEGGWTLGGTAGRANIGSAPDDVPTNADLIPPVWFRPQVLIERPTPLISYSPGTNLVEDTNKALATHTSNTSATGTCSATSTGALGQPWHAFDKSATTGHMFSTVAGTLTYVLNEPAILLGYEMSATFSANWPIGRSAKSWNFRTGVGDTPDTIKDAQVNQSWSTFGQKRTYMFAEPSATPVKSFSVQVTANVQGSEYTGIAEVVPIFGKVSDATNTVLLGAPFRAALADGESVEVFRKDAAAEVALVMNGADIKNGTQYIMSGPEGDYATDVLPTYNHAAGTWSDGKRQLALGWVTVASNSVGQIFPCAPGTYAELAPSGTTLPNPFIHLPIMAVQDGNVRAVVNNQITGVSTGGGVVRVWRVG